MGGLLSRDLSSATGGRHESQSRWQRLRGPDRICAFACISPSIAFGCRSGPVLLVADLFHPIDGLAVELFHDGDMRHGRGGRSAVPMLLVGWACDHVTRTNHFLGLTPTLRPTAARNDDQGLSQR